MNLEQARTNMVEQQIRTWEVLDQEVLDLLYVVPREDFVPAQHRALAFSDLEIPIADGERMWQPKLEARVLQELNLRKTDKVLEVGTGSGYQAAVLSELVREVYTIEIVPELAARAEALLRSLSRTNVRVRAGDGYAGWPEQAPFDRIIVTAAPEELPRPLIDQLADGGLLVAPVGRQSAPQWMTVVEKTGTGVVERRTIPVQFVPFTRGPGR